MSDLDQRRLPRYGLTWGTLHITCLAHLKGKGRVVRINGTGGQGVEVYVSQKGRIVRVFRDGKELR